MTNPANPPALRSVQFWIGICLLGVGLLGLILVGGVLLAEDSANKELLEELMRPIREDLLNTGVSSNITTQVVRGNTPSEDELGTLTPRQRKKALDSVAWFESQQTLASSVRSTVRIGAVFGLVMFCASAAMGVWLIRRRKSIFVS